MANQTSGTLPSQVQELIAVLLAEIPLLEEPLATLLEAEMAAQDQDSPPSERAALCEVYADSLDRFGDAAESVGFTGLQQVAIWLRDNVTLLATQPRPLNAAEMDLLGTWSGYAGAYLSAPNDAEMCQEFVVWLQAQDWPKPLDAAQAEAIGALLLTPDFTNLGSEEPVNTRPKTATADHVSLDLPADVQPDLLDALLQELPEQSQTFAVSIQRVVTGGSMDDLNIAKRTAHTLKGAANTVGIRGVANLTHHLEDILDALFEQKALPTPTLAITLMEASDCLEVMSEALCGIGPPPDTAQEVLQAILDWANKFDECGGLPPDAPDSTKSAPTAPIPASAPPKEAPPKKMAQVEVNTGRMITQSLVDELLRLGGESIILGGQVHEQVRRIEAQVISMQKELERLQRLGADLERLIDIRNFSVDRPNPELNVEFDALELDQYNELHSIGRMLVETATDARQIGGIVTGQLSRLDQTLMTQGRLHRETQEKVLSARMVPIKTITPRLQRGVRQTCRLTGKQVELHMQGDENLVDNEVLNGLVEPLMHVLRNAVDHGIETPNLRIDAGKPPEGEIKLEFLREGNNLLVRCKDDGAGFDFAAIRRSAEAKGLAQPGHSMTDDDLANLVLLPGFSTRTEVTQTSGRGMGLDVVYAHVLSRGGNLSLHSQPGQGTTTEIQLPVSLISTHAILTRIRGQVMAIADRGIEQILHGADGTVRIMGEQTVFQVEQRIYPLQDLDDLLRLPPDRRQETRTHPPILLVRSRSGLTAIRVQAVLAGIDLVVKDLGQYIPHLSGIIGATILGDGTVTPVLDLPELIGNASQTSNYSSVSDTESTATLHQEARSIPVVLVVDDSLSARRALVQVMEDSGYKVRAARDGLEAVTIVAEQRPDIVLADMEMPRMNGIELTAHLRAYPATANIPVIMITSRSTAKHRQQAAAAGVNAYLTKPFMDDELLEQVAILRGA